MSTFGFDMAEVMHPDSGWDFTRELDEKKH